MTFPELRSNKIIQQFQSLHQHPEISELLIDVLDFIEQKMLRMSPEKRATCKEVVDKFRVINERASVDESYCLQAVLCHPKRINTDLSTLSPHVFETAEFGASNSRHCGVQEDQSGSRPVSRVAEDCIPTDGHANWPISKKEEAQSRQRPLEVPGPRDSRGKTRLDQSPSTNRSSSRGTNIAGSKPSLSTRDGSERNGKRGGLRQRLRSLLCW